LTKRRMVGVERVFRIVEGTLLKQSRDTIKRSRNDFSKISTMKRGNTSRKTNHQFAHNEDKKVKR